MPPRRSRRLRSWLRRARRFALRHAVLVGALGLAALLSLNLAVRALGGDVHPLALGRVRERAQALWLLGRHLVVDASAVQVDPREALRAAAARHRVSTKLVLAVAQVESALVPTRISGTGAMGLMQLMPDTALELGVDDPFDPHDNADGGVRYLKQLLAMYRGDVRRALAAYNAGPGRVSLRASLRTAPEETRTYVSRIVSQL